MASVGGIMDHFGSTLCTAAHAQSITLCYRLHSSMLVPYFSWAFSHDKHHRRTNDLMDGETHVPPEGVDMGLDENHKRVSTANIRKQIYGGGSLQHALSNNLYGHARADEAMGDEGFAFFMMWSRLIFGWQFYLGGMKSVGRNGNDGKPLGKTIWPDHFRPHSRLFPAKMYWKVVASDIGRAITVGVLTYFSWVCSFRAVWFWYFGPYMLINAFLVTMTWLQHTAPTVPQFDADTWTWMKGSVAGTFDRPLYPWMNHCSHNIVTTHVVHHLFHEIPHYHAVEATKAVRGLLEPQGLYNYDPTPATSALWKVCKRCHFVDSLTDGIQHYKSLEDIPLNKHTKDAKKDQ